MRYARHLFGAIVLVLATGMASGAILDNYGYITGSTDVTGPSFHAANDSKLLINQMPNSSQKSIEYIGNNYENRFYATRDLNNEWYDATVNMTIEARKVSGSPDTTFDLNFFQTNSSGSHSVCGQEKSVTVRSTDYQNYSVTCKGNITGKVETFDYLITGSRNTEAYLKIYGNTKVELNGQ